MGILYGGMHVVLIRKNLNPAMLFSCDLIFIFRMRAVLLHQMELTFTE